MKRFAIYRRSKRRHDLLLVSWPIAAADAHTAIETTRRELRARGEPCRRLIALDEGALADHDARRRITFAEFRDWESHRPPWPPWSR